MSEIIFEIIVLSITLKAKQEEKEKHCYRVQKARLKKKKKTKQEFLYIRILMDYGRVWKRIFVLLFLWVFEMLIDLLMIVRNLIKDLFVVHLFEYFHMNLLLLFLLWINKLLNVVVMNKVLEMNLLMMSKIFYDNKNLVKDLPVVYE